MRSSTLPDFAAALARFRAFLEQNNYSENVVWVMRELTRKAANEGLANTA